MGAGVPGRAGDKSQRAAQRLTALSPLDPNRPAFHTAGPDQGAKLKPSRGLGQARADGDLKVKVNTPSKLSMLGSSCGEKKFMLTADNSFGSLMSN